MNAERFHAITDAVSAAAHRGRRATSSSTGTCTSTRASDETSIETGLPVYNVVEVRRQPGAAGTILNNLVALGVGEIHAVGFCGDDGEGYELRRALAARPGVILRAFPHRRRRGGRRSTASRW